MKPFRSLSEQLPRSEVIGGGMRVHVSMVSKACGPPIAKEAREMVINILLSEHFIDHCAIHLKNCMHY